METWYEILFSFQMRHSYYALNTCTNDFEFFATSQTLQQLKHNGLLFQSTEDGFRIVFQASDKVRTPRFPIEEDLELVIGYRLVNTALLNITNADSWPTRKSSQVYVSEGTVDEELEVVSMQLRASSFGYDFTAGADSALVKVFDESGKSLFRTTASGGEVEVEQGADPKYEFEVPIQLSTVESAIVTVEHEVDGESTQTDYYIDSALAASRPFGLLRLALDKDDIDYESEPQCFIQLAAKETQWEYHLLFQSSFKDYSFEIEDGAGEEIGPYPEEIEFDVEHDSEDYSPGQKFVLITHDSLPYYEVPRPGLKLVVQKDDNIRTYNNLPNPSISDPEPKIYINL